jgi:predicted  nucleic acid-binding Zn-ribbon protein
MKAFAFVALLTLFGAADATRASLSPVTRVVELLKDLSAKVEKDNKAEEDLYETFVCWAKSMVSQKTASNSAAESRIDMLATYISDLDSGRIELTSERKDLEKEIATLTTDIETSTNERNKEHKDFLDAEEEMEMALSALDEALDVLHTATEGHEKGVLMSLKGMMSEGATERTRQATQLHKAVDLASKVLKKGDAIFLRRVLTGETPTPDWKKLNRKATFKKSYKARSFKIQGVLAKLLEDFSANLHDATKAEEKAEATYNKLMESKNDELDTAKTSLNDMSKEGGAKGMSREQSVEEKETLEDQVTNDKKYITQVQSALSAKKEEWKVRQALRSGELAAMSKAISILHSDDSRDLFKKSFSSQDKTFLFLQESMTTQAIRKTAAIKEIKGALAATKDTRLAQLSARMQASGHFDEVIAAVDKMVALLKTEEAEDLEKKEDCEANREDGTRKAVLISRTIDEQMDTIARLTKEIADLAKEIEENEAAVKENEEEITKITEIREKENADYVVAKKDDEDAAAVVQSAADVLKNFYAENGLGLVQKAKKQPFASTAGEAPPPPPPTWTEDYGGKTGESQGVVAVLGLIKSDIEKDIAKADDEEKASKEMYEASKTALTNEINDLNKAISEAKSTKADKESEVADTEDSKATKKGELKAKFEQLDGAAEGCEFFTINYPLRLKNRQIEMDGLEKAKAILSGAVFEEPKDPNREIKPGDALVQKQQKNLRQVRKH